MSKKEKEGNEPLTKEDKAPASETKHYQDVKKDVTNDTVVALRPNLKKFIIPILRRATYRWKPRSEAYANARKERGKYECAMCKNLFGPKEVDLDHVDPVVDFKHAFIDLNTYIDRMFPEVQGWQVLCKTCHSIKTIEEDSMRAFYNQKRKEFIKKEKKKLTKKNKK